MQNGNLNDCAWHAAEIRYYRHRDQLLDFFM